MQKRQTGERKEKGQKQREGQRGGGEVTGHFGYLLFHLRLTYYDKKPLHFTQFHRYKYTHFVFFLSNIGLLT